MTSPGQLSLFGESIPSPPPPARQKATGAQRSTAEPATADRTSKPDAAHAKDTPVHEASCPEQAESAQDLAAEQASTPSVASNIALSKKGRADATVALVAQRQEHAAIALLHRISTAALDECLRRARMLGMTDPPPADAFDEQHVEAMVAHMLQSPSFDLQASLLALGPGNPNDPTRDNSDNVATPSPRRAALTTSKPRSTSSTTNQGRTKPIVTEGIWFGTKVHHYALPEMRRCTLKYATPTTVRLEFSGGKEVTETKGKIYCLPDGDEAAYDRLLEQYETFQEALDMLAAALQGLGRYDDKLRNACRVDDPTRKLSDADVRRAPNPLSPWVIEAPVPPEPGARPTITVWELWALPKVQRFQTKKHTPQRLTLVDHTGAESNQHVQNNKFVCADEATWTRIQGLVTAIEQAKAAWLKQLEQLGSYAAAVLDGRYQKEASTNDATVSEAPVQEETASITGPEGPRDPLPSRPIILATATIPDNAALLLGQGAAALHE